MSAGAVPERTIEETVARSELGGAERWWVRAFDELPILAVDITGRDVFATWESLTRKVAGTGWSAVAWLDWGFGSPAEIERQLADRYEFEEAHRPGAGPQPTAYSPDHLLAAARAWTDPHIDDRLHELEIARDAEMAYLAEDERVRDALDCSARVAGAAPSPGDIPLDVRRSESALDRWLLDWELAHAEPPRDHVQPWFDPRPEQHPRLWLIPRDAPFAAVAVQHWWESDTPFELAVFRRWHRRWGARLVAHWGTMLQVVAERLPSSVDEAWALAREQDLLCSSLLGPAGEARRHLALGLMHSHRWFLHSRP